MVSRMCCHPLKKPTTLAESLKNFSNLDCPQDDNNADFHQIEEPDLTEREQQNIKSEFDLFSSEERLKVTGQDIPLSHEEGSYHDCKASNIVSPEADTFSKSSSTHVHKKSPTLTTTSKTIKHKWRRRKAKYCKKNSVAEILAAAKHCTVEDLQWINKFCYIGSEIEGCHQMGPLENNSRSEITNEGSNEKAESDENELANVDRKGRSTDAFKIKPNGYKSELGNIK